MPILDTNGQPISAEELELAEELLAGSLDSHIDRLRVIAQRHRNKEEAEKFYQPLLEIYVKARKDLASKCREVASGKQNITVTDFLSGYLDAVAAAAVKKVDQNSPAFRDFLFFVATGWGNPAYRALIGGAQGPIPEPEQDREESLQASIGDFRFSDEPAPGIEKIETYHPGTDSVKALYTLRTGNSTTLKKNVEELEREKEELRRRTDLNDREKERRMAKLDQAIDAYVKGRFGIDVAGEVARSHAQKIAEKPQVTAADLFRALSELNRANRPDEDLGGKLRGSDIHAGAINGVSAGRAPAVLYRTLSIIAGYMNEVKAVQDPNLQKTRAVELATLSDDLLISEHVFADTNGRTCRMFTDTILQSFGLPPHTPLKERTGKAKSLGAPVDHQGNAQIVLRGIQKSDEILKEDRRLREERKKQNEELRDYRQAVELDSTVSSLESLVGILAEDAETRLRELETMTKKGHVNNDEYIRMHDALKAVSELDPKKVSPRQVEEALEELRDAAAEYQRTHTGLFVANSGYGGKRLEASKEYQSFARDRQVNLHGFMTRLDKDAPIASQHPSPEALVPKEKAPGRKRAASVPAPKKHGSLAPAPEEKAPEKKGGAPKL